MNGRTTTILTCPHCGRAGSALWQRGPHAARELKALVNFSAGFTGVDDGSRDAPRFRCAACKVTAIETPAANAA